MYCDDDRVCLPFMFHKRAREKDAIWQSHDSDAVVESAGILASQKSSIMNVFKLL